ncbi:hypothetical protein GKC56_08585 [Neisseriaceae bacterium PsAf]|nr:hypothetical protein [Neisseriaceae bacterium PsAf]
MFLERENNGVKEYYIGKGAITYDELAFAEKNNFEINRHERYIDKWVPEDELEIYEVKKEVDDFFK